MPLTSNISISSTFTFVTVSDSAGGMTDTEKRIFLPNTTGDQSRILYLKEITGQSSNYFLIYPASNTLDGVGNASSLTVNTLGCLQLQANGTNWDILDNYDGTVGVTNTTVPGGTTQVNASANASYINVDLSATSKQVILPLPSSLSPANQYSMYYTIKDINGNASSNYLYVSGDGGALIDNASNIILSSAFASVQVLGDPNLNKWFITGYYSGI